MRRRALRRSLDGRACSLLSSPVKPECDLPLILFNELPINEGNSRQRWKRFVIRDLRLSIHRLLSLFARRPHSAAEHTSWFPPSAKYFAKSWYPAKWNNYSGRQDRLKTKPQSLFRPLYLYPERRIRHFGIKRGAFWIARYYCEIRSHSPGYIRNGLNVNIKAAERYIKF